MCGECGRTQLPKASEPVVRQDGGNTIVATGNMVDHGIEIEAGGHVKHPLKQVHSPSLMTRF